MNDVVERVSSAAIVVVLAGCGRIRFDAVSDGATTDTGTLAACTQPGPWSAPELLPGHAGINDMKLSADKRELYGARFNADYDLVRATRSSPVAAFSADTTMSLSSPDRDVDPAITADGLELYFSSDRLPIGSLRFYVAQRASTDEDFTTATLVPGLETESAYSLDVTPDGLSLYAEFSIGFGVATRPARGAMFGAPVAEPEVVNNYPTVSFDELEMYTNDATLPTINRYTRPAKTAPWQLDTTFSIPGFNGRDPDLTHDGRELWFWSSADTELYRLTRTCLQ